MKQFSILLILASAILSCGGNDPVNPGTDPIPSVPTPSFAKGADISWVSEMEKDGKTFRTADGNTADIFAVLAETGVNAIRLRVWVDPYNGWSGKDDVVKLATRAAKAGMALMIDFHYSDFFADPGRQIIPAAWTADKADVTKMAEHVSNHTTEVLKALKDAGVKPAWIQIGNETRGGMLYGTGDLNYKDEGNEFQAFLKLYNAGYDAAKTVFPSVLVMPHIDKAFDLGNNEWWFTCFKNQGGKYDMIALSHYPQASWDGKKQIPWATANSQAINSIKTLASIMGVPVIISEVGVKTSADEATAARVLSEFMAEAKKIGQCKGVFYWEPEVYGGWKPAIYSLPDQIYKYAGERTTWGAYDMGAFLAGGKASSVMNAFK